MTFSETIFIFSVWSVSAFLKSDNQKMAKINEGKAQALNIGLPWIPRHQSIA